MATDRQTPCLYYVCAGFCTKGRKADHAHYCQHCNKYQPRAKVRYKNQKKEKLEKIRKDAEAVAANLEGVTLTIATKVSSTGTMQFGRIYDCEQCHNENAFDIYTVSNISVFHNRQGNYRG